MSLRHRVGEYRQLQIWKIAEPQSKSFSFVFFFYLSGLHLLAEMAKRLANILRAVLSLQQGDVGASSVPLTQLAPHITRLPMPEDYTLDELRGLTQSYLQQLIVS